MALTQLQKAQVALDKAEAKDRDVANKAQAKQIKEANLVSSKNIKEQSMAADKTNKTLDGDVGDSKRERVTVERKYTDGNHRIFVSTVITKKGKSVLEQFRVPVNVPVELPVEIIACLKDRTIDNSSSAKVNMVNEFVVTAA